MSTTPRRPAAPLCAAALAVFALAACDNRPLVDDTPPYDFAPFGGLSAPPDVSADRLCAEAADPDNAPDEVFIDCELEGANLAPDTPPARDQLVVMAYNMERGLQLDEQIRVLRDDPAVPLPDVLLATEIDRGCSRTNGRNVPWEIAEALGYNYAFAVEFIELPRSSGGGGEITSICEHGNAVFSRYPIGNVGALRHTTNKSWYIPPEERTGDGEPRLGGRILVYADVQVGERILHVYSLHFESSPADNDIQIAQAIEAAEHGLGRRYRVVQGGDTNAPFYFIDLIQETTNDQVTQAFFERGYVDAHTPLPADQRGTRDGLVLDILFGNSNHFSAPAICSDAVCGALSDHLPIWATVALN